MRRVVLCVMLASACCRNVPQKFTGQGPANSADRSAPARHGFPDNAKATVSVSSGFIRASGVAINRRGDILTSLHLVPEGADPMHVVWEVRARTRSFRAESLYWSRELDMIVLRSETPPERYARFASAGTAPERSATYMIGRIPGHGVVKFHGIYIRDALPFAGAPSRVSNYLLPSARVSSGGGIFRSADDALIGIGRLAVNERSALIPTSGATIEQIKLFLRCHRIDFEEI